MSEICPRCGGVEPLTVQVGTTLQDCPHPWHAGPVGRPITPAEVAAIQHAAETRLSEIGEATGCEASSARSFEEGRLSVLRALGLWRDWSPAEVLERRRRELNEALPHGRGHR